jgi:thiol-disulfide isomerase/thioredoxin
MPHARDAILTQIVQVSDLGSNEGMHHFDVRMSNGHQVQVWFRDKNGLPEKITSHFRRTSGDQQTEEVVVESKLEWQIADRPSNRDINFTIPEGAQQVTNLGETLQGRGVEDLYGKPLPKIDLVGLDGQPVTPPSQKVGLFYFWATWAAPSLDGIPSIMEFRDSLQAEGVFVLSVNVGEDVERVKQFMELNKLTGSMGLDPNGMAAHEWRITHLPAVVIIGSDGTVHQVIQNVKEDMRQRITAEVKQLLDKK